MAQEYDSLGDTSETFDSHEQDALHDDVLSLGQSEKLKRKAAYKKKQQTKERLLDIQEQKWIRRETGDIYD